MTSLFAQLAFRPRALCGLLHRPFSLSSGNGLGLSSRSLLQTRSFFLQPRNPSRPSFPGLATTSPLSKGFPTSSNILRWISTTSRSSSRHYARRPPPQNNQFLGFLDKIPQNAVFTGILVLNALVFGMWLLAKAKYTQERDPSAIIWLRDNFTSSWKNLSSGRVYTLLTACFSHADWSHILFNGFTFFFMARPVLEILGSRQFLFLYLGGGVMSSLSGSLYAKITGQNNFSSHGASGAIYSIVTLLACVAPRLTFNLYGIIPVPAWLAVTGFFSYDLYRSVYSPSGTTDTVGHVGGILAGVGYFVMKRLRLF